jgi:hypothetical protein
VAEETQLNIPAGNGERLELRVGSKSLGFTTKDLVSVLLVVVMGVGFYLTVQSMTDRLDRGAHNQDVGFQKLEKLLDVMHTNQAAMLAGLQSNREVTGSKLDAQDERLHHQTSVINTKVDTLEKYIEEWFTEMGRRQEMMNFNVLHPDKALPLRAPSPHEERQPERGR